MNLFNTLGASIMPADSNSPTHGRPQVGLAHQAAAIALWLLVSHASWSLTEAGPTLLTLATDVVAGLIVCFATKVRGASAKFWLGFPAGFLAVSVLVGVVAKPQETQSLAMVVPVGLHLAGSIIMAFIVQPLLLDLVLLAHLAIARRGKKNG